MALPWSLVWDLPHAYRILRFGHAVNVPWARARQPHVGLKDRVQPRVDGQTGSEIDRQRARQRGSWGFQSGFQEFALGLKCTPLDAGRAYVTEGGKDEEISLCPDSVCGLDAKVLPQSRAWHTVVEQMYLSASTAQRVPL